MKKISNCVLCLCCVFLCACNDYLDIKPKGVTLPEYYEDYRRLMNHKELMSIEDIYPNYITDDVLLGDEDVSYGQFILAQEHQQNLYSFQNGAILSKGMSDYLWENAYKRIYTLNVVINNVGECTDASEKEKNELIAIARMNRAYEYLVLVNAYANHYDPTTATGDLGVPLILSEDINKAYKRNSVAEVYVQILSDLEYAEINISQKVSSPYFPDIRSTNALFSKTYLYMGNYVKAKEYAEKVITDVPELIDLTAYIIHPTKQGMGRVYNPVTDTSYPTMEEENPECLLKKDGDQVSLSRNIYLSQDFLEIFEHDLPEGTVDQRRALFTVNNVFKLYNDVAQFPGKTMWVAYSDFNAGLNYQEIMLTLAECYVRLNMAGEDADGLGKAYKLLDDLRDHRILNNRPLLRSNAQTALRTVLEERRREFPFHGCMRLTDLKRLNREDAFKKEIVHTVGAQSWSLPANDPRYILPIPPKVLGENPSIPQLER